MAAPTLVAAYAALTTSNLTSTTSSLSLQSGDIVVVMAMGEGANNGDSFNAPTTTFANGGVTQLQIHAASNNCNGGAWTFTVSTTGSGTVSVVQTQGGAGTKVQLFSVRAYRGGVAPTVARSALQAGSSRTISYTASQADSGISYIIGDWAAAAVQTPSPSSAHTNVAPGPTAYPYSLASGSAMTGYADVYDDQTLTTSQTYGIGGSGTGPFTIIVAEVQGAASGTPVSLTGVVAAVTVAAPVGTVATQVNVALTGAVASVAIGAPVGTVLASGPISLTGAVAALAVAAPAGTVSASSPIALTGAVAGVSTAAPAGTLALTVSLTASPASIATAAPAGTVAVQKNVALTGVVAAVSTAAPAGTVATVVSVALTGAVANATAAAPAGTVSVQTSISLTGAVAATTIAAPAGTFATGGSINLPGPVASVTITAPAGTLSAQTVVSLTGVPASVTISAPAGTVAAGSGSTVSLTGVTATLSVGAPPGTVTAIVSVTYIFTPPTQKMHYGNWFTQPLTSRIGYPTGATLLKSNGFYTIRWDAPSQTDINNADIVYLGGHSYTVSQSEAAALTAAGYGSNITTQ